MSSYIRTAARSPASERSNTQAAAWGGKGERPQDVITY
jgi:hypothetical protein